MRPRRRRSGLLGFTGSLARAPRHPSDGWAVRRRENVADSGSLRSPPTAPGPAIGLLPAALGGFEWLDANFSNGRRRGFQQRVHDEVFFIHRHLRGPAKADRLIHAP